MEKFIEKEAFDDFKVQIEILDKNIFEVIDKLVSRHELHALHFWDQQLTQSYDMIKKGSTLSKYRKSIFLKEHEVNPHEELFMDLKVSKREYNFLTKVLNPGMAKVKNNYKKGIEMLLNTRDVFVECLFNHFSTMTSVVRSKAVNDEKIFRANLDSAFKISEAIPPAEIWGIKKSSKTLNWNIIPIEELNKYANTKLDAKDPRFKMDVDCYVI